MKNSQRKLKISLLALAVAGALAEMYTLPAYAEDDEVKTLITPTNSVEIGVLNTSRSSAKFGEYNGLNKEGADFVGNFSISGGNAHGEENGIRQWEMTGKDLGVTSREFGASIRDQGQWNLGIGYDELRHNTTDSYQTPYQGSMGGNNFRLPANFGTAANTTTLNPSQKSDLHTVDVGTTRKNTSLTAGYNFDTHWDIKFDYNRLDQSGAKLMSFGSMSHGTSSGENVSILPNPTSYKTDTVNLALNWVGDKAHATASYFGSFFHDDYDRVTFETYRGGNQIQTMSTAPSNDFHQLNLAGGYAFSPKTKLAGAFSYGRNTQNDSYANDSFMMITPSPTSSLNGVVVTTHADLKLTDQTIKDLSLSAGLKYDKRDNQTTSNIYNFLALDGGNAAKYPNTPLSYDKTQIEVAGDYRLSKKQNIRLAYNHDDVKRWCDEYATNVGYPAGTNCVVATSTREDKIGAAYKLKASDDLSLNAGYTYGDRKTNSDQNAIAAFISTKGGVAGQNGGDFNGFYPYFDASRTQQMVKAGVNWQANEKLSFGLNGRYTDDQYDDSTYGVQNGNSWSVNLDATVNYSENGSIFGYLTQQYRQRDLTDQQASTTANATRINVPLGATWSNQLKDNDTTIGLGFKQGGLISGKLDLAGDLTYSIGKTSYGTQLNYAGVTTGGLTCGASILLSCGQLPDVKNSMTQFKLTGTYKIDKRSKVALGYLFQRLSSADYYYNGLQYGLTPTSLMPTNQQSGSYSVNTVALTYLYNF